MLKKSYVLAAIAGVGVIGTALAVSQGVFGPSEELAFPAGAFGEFRWQDEANGIQVGSAVGEGSSPVLRKVDLAEQSAVYAWIRKDGDMEVAVMYLEDCQEDDLLPIGLAPGTITSRHLRCYVGEEHTFLWHGFNTASQDFEWVWSEELNNWKVYADFRQWPLQQLAEDAGQG